MRLLAIVLAVAVLLYGGICLALFLGQRALVYFPQPRRLQADTITVHAPGADVLVTTLKRPGSAAVLYFGGNADDVSTSLPLLARAFPDQALYLMHYRGYGGSGGQPGEAALKNDARALFDQVSGQHLDVTAIGRSLGSGIAIDLAATRPVRRLVLVTPYDSIDAIAAASFPWIPVRALLTEHYRSIDLAPRITIPVTIVQAQFDSVIPAANTERLWQAFRPGIATRVVMRGAGHNDVDGAVGYLEALRGE